MAMGRITHSLLCRPSTTASDHLNRAVCHLCCLPQTDSFSDFMSQAGNEAPANSKPSQKCSVSLLPFPVLFYAHSSWRRRLRFSIRGRGFVLLIFCSQSLEHNTCLASAYIMNTWKMEPRKCPFIASPFPGSPGWFKLLSHPWSSLLFLPPCTAVWLYSHQLSACKWLRLL